MSTTPAITFGTDGWRGVIADTFTFDNVRLVAQAIADYVRAQAPVPHGIVIGYDNRFQGEHFARLVAEVMLGNRIPVALATEPLPTPAISFAAFHHQLDGGIMITASHNPPEYSGIKFKTTQGASADPAVTRMFETNIGKTPVATTALENAGKGLRLNLAIAPPYFDWVRSFINYDVLARAQYTVVVDSMYGVGARHIETLLAGTAHRVTTIRAERNPSFNGIAPEPVPKNMAATIAAVQDAQADVALVTDGDADRLAALDNRGEYIITPKIAVLLALHLLKNRGWRGDMVKTLSCSVVVDRFAREHGLTVHEKPVGFKNIVPYLVSGAALIGTEESGGLGIQKHIPERDGILGGLLFLEALAGLGFANAGAAMDYLDQQFGVLRYDRIDAHYTPTQKASFLQRISAAPPKELLGQRVVRIKDFDGIKFECADDSWLLLRFSGTEPVVRFYAEAPSAATAAALTKLGLHMLTSA
ncbi:MAG: phosphoglucomutase/phosphomannomutase family protein [bacterium]|nr:phosphoglucomutase/phosphomannomutase family protein [bacterium]